jgi:hypothetical protein
MSKGSYYIGSNPYNMMIDKARSPNFSQLRYSLFSYHYMYSMTHKIVKRVNDFTSQINGLSGSTAPSPKAELVAHELPASRVIHNKLSKNQLTSLERHQLGYNRYLDDSFYPEKRPLAKKQMHLNSSFEGAGILFSEKKEQKQRNQSTTRKSYHNRESSLTERDDFLSNSCRDSLLSAAQIGLRDITKVSCSRSLSGSKGRGAFSS